MDRFENLEKLREMKEGANAVPIDSAGLSVDTSFVAALAITALLAYTFITWSRRREGSELADDGQVGLKIIIYSLLALTLAMAAAGLENILAFLFAGAKAKGQIKAALGGLITGGGMFALVFFLFLPKTNTKDYARTERMYIGLVAATASVITIMALANLLTGLFTGASWKGAELIEAANHGMPVGHDKAVVVPSAAFSNMLVYGAIAFLALFRFGGMSGWTTPVRAMPAGFPQQPMAQPGMQPQQPQAQFPPQGGGYPPQGGGVPPQGQPGGGGYPPQGGGGLPPPSGGGYPPGGGGYPPA